MTARLTVASFLAYGTTKKCPPVETGGHQILGPVSGLLDTQRHETRITT